MFTKRKKNELPAQWHVKHPLESMTTQFGLQALKSKEGQSPAPGTEVVVLTCCVVWPGGAVVDPANNTLIEPSFKF